MDRWIDDFVATFLWVGRGLATALVFVALYHLGRVIGDLDHLPHALYMVFPEEYPWLSVVDGRFLHRSLYWLWGTFSIMAGALALGWTIVAIRLNHVDT